jgi:hypothetical protein
VIRHSIRLKGYDYTRSGAYILTIVTYQRECLFGELVEGEIISNAFGVAARDEWFRTAELRSNVRLFSDEMVAMPNHIHGILWIAGIEMDVGRGAASLRPYETPQVVPDSLGTIVRAFKSAVTYRINRHQSPKMGGGPIPPLVITLPENPRQNPSIKGSIIGGNFHISGGHHAKAI